MNAYVLLAGGLLWAASVACAAGLAFKLGGDSELATQAREDKAAAHAADAAASAISAAIPKITVRHQTVRQELEREIRTNPVYLRTDCDSGPDSLRLYNSTIPGYVEPAAPGAGAVPASHAGH